eukprot:m.307555 g.307555  ORF g.307555 m.307555 type:complete len:388 (+) comp20110_c0_seq1:2-1165(+)
MSFADRVAELLREHGVSNGDCAQLLEEHSSALGLIAASEQSAIVAELLQSVVKLLCPDARPSKRPRTDADGTAAAAALEPVLAALDKVRVTTPGVLRNCRLEVRSSTLTWIPAKGDPVVVPLDQLATVLAASHPVPQKKMKLFVLHFRCPVVKDVCEISIQVKDNDTSALEVAAGAPAPLRALEGLTEPFTVLFPKFLKAAHDGLQYVDVQGRGMPCYWKATEGFLYLLNEGVLFQTKTLFVPFQDIARFDLALGTSRDFHLHVHLQSGRKLEFMVPREFEQAVAGYMDDTAKWILKQNKSLAESVEKEAEQLDDNENDEEENVKPDVHKTAPKAVRDAATMDTSDSEEDSEEDDDFNPEDIESESGSEESEGEPEDGPADDDDADM